MRLVTYRANIEAAARLGAVVDDLVVDVEKIGAHAGIALPSSMLDLIERALVEDGLAFCRLDGSTKGRGVVVEKFQGDASIPVFLISLKAGGVGLNLTAASHVVLYDRWWNPAVEAQAIDRTHRIGQSREVFAYRLIAAGTIEEKVLELQRTKRDLADAILSPAHSGVRNLQQEDLEVLLS